MPQWDDLALFLALHRERSTVRAAQALGISQPTVVRRLAALEHRLGLCLFDRTPSGLEPTEAAGDLLVLAEQAESGVMRFEAEAGHLAGRDQARVRLTFLDHFERLLIPVLRDYRAQWPNVGVELLASDRIFDLSKNEADIAVRGRAKPESADVLVRPLPPSGWTVYGASIAAADFPKSPESLTGRPILLPSGPPGALPIYRWLESLAPDEAPRCTGYGALRSAIATGAGFSALPVTIGDHDADVARCFPVMRQFDVPIYLAAARPSLRKPPARDLFERIFRFFHDQPELLAGVD